MLSSWRDTGSSYVLVVKVLWPHGLWKDNPSILKLYRVDSDLTLRSVLKRQEGYKVIQVKYLISPEQYSMKFSVEY